MEQTDCPTAACECTLRTSGPQPAHRKGQMLDHLLKFEPELLPTTEAPPPAERATPVQELNAKIETTEWLKTMGAPDTEEVVSELEKRQARETFTALTAAAPIKEQKELITRLETPPAVRHLVGMLTAYDWEFVQQAKELRGYAVAKILEDCEHTNANIRLKALGLLGKVTEVGLFTEKIEVKQTDMTESEIDAKLKEKLAKFMHVSDAQVIDVGEIHTSPGEIHTSQDENDVDPDNPDA